MLEVFERVIGGVLPSVIKSIVNRSRLKIICGWGHEVNGDGVGTFLAMWVKIINPTSSSVYFERVEVVDQVGGAFFPIFFRVNSGDEIKPLRSIVGLIPCGHVTLNSRPKEIRVYDETERKYIIKGRMLRNVISSLEAEMARLESLNFTIHPTTPYPE